MIYVVFHGGGGSSVIANAYSYADSGGSPITKGVLDIPGDVKNAELRDIGFGPDGSLYVVNSRSSGSSIMKFAGKPGADGKHAFAGDISPQPATPHPTRPDRSPRWCIR